MGKIEQDVSIRIKLLEIIKECNKKLDFTGSRGEQWMDTMRLQQLAEDLISQLPDEGEEVKNEDNGSTGDIG